jgi:hypothetical protein
MVKLKDTEKIQKRIESATRKWWFFLILLLLQMLPPFTSEPVSPQQAGLVIGAVLSQAIVYDLSLFFPVFKILSILMIASVFTLNNRVSRIFSVYVGVMYVLFAFLQSIAFTEEFGFSLVTVNLLMFLMVAVIWFWEAVTLKNNLEAPQFERSRVWVIPFAVMAFWYPINIDTMMLDFDPLLLLTNEASLAFCMMTPVFLSILILFYPNINIATLRVTSSIGIVISFYNILTNFVMFPELLFWNGILHIPLTIISVYAFTLSIRHRIPGQLGTLLEVVPAP